MWNLLLALALMQSSGGGPTVTSQPAPASSSKPATFSDTELASIKTSAAAGDIKAEMDLAEAYETGSGVPANDELAAQWCRKAAEQGYATAQNHLGAEVLPEGTELHVENVLVSGDWAVVELHSLATAKNGLRFDNRYCWVCRFAGGEIAQVRAYLDSALVARLFQENPIPNQE